MKSFRVLSALLNPETRLIEVVKEITNDDNSTELNLHTFHPEAAEWKAAELDLDTLDDAVDSILHEPFMEDMRSLELSATDAKALHQGRLASLKAKLGPQANSPVAAKKARLVAAGIHQKYIDAADNDPLTVIKQHSLFDPDVIAVKREHTDLVRRNFIVQNRTQSTQETPRAEQLRRILMPKVHPSGDRQVNVPVEEPDLPPIILGKESKRQRGAKET
jgi:hypothetical protein